MEPIEPTDPELTPESQPDPNPELTPDLQSDPVLMVSEEGQAYLREAGKWAVFMAILGFIFCGLMLMMIFFFSKSIVTFENNGYTESTLPENLKSVIISSYVLLDVLYFFFAFYLYRFGNLTRKGIVFTDNAQLTAAFEKLKSFFKLWGITTIVIVSFCILYYISQMVVKLGNASLLPHH